MRRAGLAVITAAFVLFAPAVAAPDNCGPFQGFTLVLEPVARGYLIPMAVAGTPKRLLLELDSAFTKLDEKIAAELKLPLKGAPSGFYVADTVGRFVSIATAPDATLGPVVRKNFEFFIGPRRNYWGSADGVAGLNLLYGLDIELDLAHNRLGLFLPRPCAFQVFWNADVAGDGPFKTEPTGNIHLAMTLDGKGVDVMLDTTEKQSFIPLTSARELFGIKMNDPALVPTAFRLTTGEPLFRYKFNALVGGDRVKVDDPEIYIYDNGSPPCGGKRAGWDGDRPITCYGQADLRLGSGLLSKLHLFFSFKNKKVYFSLSEPHAGKSEVRPAP